MKKLNVCALFLCLGILSVPLHTYAEKAFSWDEAEGDNSYSSDGNLADDAASSDEDEKYPSRPLYTRNEMKDMVAEKYDELKEAYEIKDTFRRTKKIDSLDSYILNFSRDHLAEKKITFLGDSITAGNGGTLTPDGSGMNYTDFIARYTSAEIVNLGIGGTSFSSGAGKNAFVERYKDIPADSDIIVIFGGFNDLFAGSSNFGSMESAEAGTYCGDVRATFAGIAEDYPDDSVYVVITYPNKMEQYKKNTGEKWQTYADVQLKLAEEYEFHTINLYKEGFLDSNNPQVRNAFFKDDIHPDDLGSEVLGRHILVHLLRKYR